MRSSRSRACSDCRAACSSRCARCWAWRCASRVPIRIAIRSRSSASSPIPSDSRSLAIPVLPPSTWSLVWVVCRSGGRGCAAAPGSRPGSRRETAGRDLGQSSRFLAGAVAAQRLRVLGVDGGVRVLEPYAQRLELAADLGEQLLGVLQLAGGPVRGRDRARERGHLLQQREPPQRLVGRVDQRRRQQRQRPRPLARGPAGGRPGLRGSRQLDRAPLQPRRELGLQPRPPVEPGRAGARGRRGVPRRGVTDRPQLRRPCAGCPDRPPAPAAGPAARRGTRAATRRSPPGPRAVQPPSERSRGSVRSFATFPPACHTGSRPAAGGSATL